MADVLEWFTCSCHTEALRIDWFDDGSDEVYLSLWRRGGWGGRLPLRQRLRYIWAALRGKPYTDHLVLHRDNADRLARTLLRTSPHAVDVPVVSSGVPVNWTYTSTRGFTGEVASG